MVITVNTFTFHLSRHNNSRQRHQRGDPRPAFHHPQIINFYAQNQYNIKYLIINGPKLFYFREWFLHKYNSNINLL